MPTTLYIATTLDGYIADPDGCVSFLDGFGADDHGYDAFFASVDVLVMGRQTYRFVQKHGNWPYGNKPCLVATRTQLDASIGQPIPVSGNPHEILGVHASKNVWLVGGGQLVSQFHEADMIDTYRIFVVPVTIGEGIPLFPSAGSSVRKLRTVAARSLSDGIVELTYARDN